MDSQVLLDIIRDAMITSTHEELDRLDDVLRMLREEIEELKDREESEN